MRSVNSSDLIARRLRHVVIEAERAVEDVPAPAVHADAGRAALVGERRTDLPVSHVSSPRTAPQIEAGPRSNISADITRRGYRTHTGRRQDRPSGRAIVAVTDAGIMTERNRAYWAAIRVNVGYIGSGAAAVRYEAGELGRNRIFAKGSDDNRLRQKYRHRRARRNARSCNRRHSAATVPPRDNTDNAGFLTKDGGAIETTDERQGRVAWMD